MSNIYFEDIYFADNDESDEDYPERADNNEKNGEREEEDGIDETTDEPQAKRRRTGYGMCVL